ncbi:hypothetical protein [Cryptosporangium sp. NPDC048952]|uniref:hypothetical protein n=1 Tax=Cryptosporangium sp. NPDC048952 TaxID=3363961 RepID=UPI003719BFCB
MALVSGCGAPASVQNEARETAVRFTTAISAGELPAACAQLTPITRTELESDEESACPDALQAAALPSAGAPGRVDVYGQQARVVFGGDTLFLARTPSGWKVSAAGCQLHAGDVYDCTVKGK